MAQDEECDYKELSVKRKLLFASSRIVAMLAMGGVAYFTFANIGEVYSYRVGYDHVAISVLYSFFISTSVCSWARLLIANARSSTFFFPTSTSKGQNKPLLI